MKVVKQFFSKENENVCFTSNKARTKREKKRGRNMAKTARRFCV